MANNQNDTMLRTIFRSEITWVISIIVVVWSVVTTVVMPIQALQLGQLEIQHQLSAEAQRYIDNEARITILEKNQAVVLSKLQIKENK